MNTKLFLFALLLLSSLAQASGLYIKLGTTTSAKQVEEIRKIVKERGYALQIQKDKERYRLYVGAFGTQTQAFGALQALKGIFPAAQAVKLHSQTFASADAQGDFSRKNDRPIFVQIALGFHSTASEMSPENANVKLPSATGMSYGVGAGYMFTSRLWSSLNYDVLGTGDVALNNAYATLNYNFWQTRDLSAYAGALVGHATLSWDTPPLKDATTVGPSSFFAGGQLGMNYALGLGGLSAFSSYSLTSFNLKTKVSASATTTTAIEQTMTHKIQLGLQYNF